LRDDFIERYKLLSRQKDSYLCVGLDPALSAMRSKFVIPDYLVQEYGRREGTIHFCEDMIKAVAKYAPIIKLNAWYILPLLRFEETHNIVDLIKANGCLAMLDAKLSDIGETNAAALYWISEMGFDAVTFSPFQGYQDGTDVVYEWARKNGKGLFVLCKMSNPGAADYQSRKIRGEPLYRIIARDGVKHGAHGFVVGCTVENELREVREVIGEERLIFAPGLGPQGGNAEVAFKYGANKKGEGLIVSASRSINYAYDAMRLPAERFAEAAGEQARIQRERLNAIRERALHAALS